MRKSSAVMGSLVFLVLAPGTVAGLVPWWISGYRFAPPSPETWVLRIAGGLLVAAGLGFLLDCFLRFTLKGLGTPAPIAPPQRLVVSGYYRYVRNPMYVAVLGIVIGQALLFGNPALLAYGALVWFCFYVFVTGFEEPVLRKTFGAEYATYCAHVPRWIPRLRGWEPHEM